MEAAKAAHQWCTNFQAAIDKKDVDAIVEAFTDDGWWRDMLTFTFDFNSFKSRFSSFQAECEERAGIDR